MIAVIDTGIRTTHEDLMLNRARGYNAVTRCWEGQGASCRIGPLGTAGAGGNAGHGTATTGAAAATGNNGVGITGVGWNLGHRMMRTTGGDPLGNDEYCAFFFPVCHAAIVAAQAGDSIVTVQIGVGAFDVGQELARVLREEYDALLIWAAGNQPSTVDVGHRDRDDLIIVGGTNRLDGSFGTTGPSVDLVAPGVQIRSTGAGSDSAYSTGTGTSYSAPLVAGLCGLIRSYDPALTADEVEFILKAGVEDLGPPGQDDTFGHGRINVHRSLQLVATRLGREVCPTSPGSQGRGARFQLFGSPKVVDNDLRLRATGLPAGTVARVLVGTRAANPADSRAGLCAGGTVVALPPILTADGDGLIEHRVDLGTAALAGVITGGSSTVIQIWYRDSGIRPAGIGLSNAIQVEWL